jgi:molybdopterin/thiamine biosynthesis adenylyltransferase
VGRNGVKRGEVVRTEENGRIKYTGEYDDATYWERIKRNLGWMGNTEEEWRANQERLRDATIGIAGTGGIGGATAMRLVRMGARHIKIADPEDFELSNIQRQAGAALDTIGRNKAEVVGEQAFALTRDAEIEIFPQGLNDETAEDFVAGCDIVTDQIEVFEWDAKYALHNAFRNSSAKAMYSVATMGHGALVHKYTPDSMSIEELYQIPEGTRKAPDSARMLAAQAPWRILPPFPKVEAILRWGIEDGIVPIFGAAPATCEGVLIECICREVMDLPGTVEFPVRPGYAFFDAYLWKAEVVDEAAGKAELDQAIQAAQAAVASGVQ